MVQRQAKKWTQAYREKQKAKVTNQMNDLNRRYDQALSEIGKRFQPDNNDSKHSKADPLGAVAAE